MTYLANNSAAFVTGLSKTYVLDAQSSVVGNRCSIGYAQGAPRLSTTLRKTTSLHPQSSQAVNQKSWLTGVYLPTYTHVCTDICNHKTVTTASVATGRGEQILSDLLKENAAFVSGLSKSFPDVPAERQRLASEGQTPTTAIIACADSRVAPEILFRANIGELFVVRAAGNTAWGEEVLGSLEFAVDFLNVDVVLVLGHTQCGAVAAACAGGDPLPGVLGKHIINISKGIEGHQNDVDAAVARNVSGALEYLRKDPDGVVPRAEKNRGLVVKGGVYDIATGEVKIIE